MKTAMLSIAAMAALLVPEAAKAGTYYEWSGSSCCEFAPDGSKISEVNTEICRRSARSGLRAYYEWSGSSCFEFAPNGSKITQMDIEICQRLARSGLRSYQGWSGSSCFEFSPDGSKITQLGTDVCRRNASFDANSIVRRLAVYQHASGSMMEARDFVGKFEVRSPEMLTQPVSARDPNAESAF